MIDLVYFAIGFIIYMLFNIITFNTYSKKEGFTRKYVLFIIFLYYSILSIYIINLVDYNGSNIIEITIQSLIYLLAGGFFLNFYYIDVIEENS